MLYSVRIHHIIKSVLVLLHRGGGASASCAPASTANEARSNPHLHLSSGTPCHRRFPPPPWNLVKARTAHRSLVHEARVAKRKQERMEGRLQDLRKDLRFAEELNLSLRGNEAQWDQHVRSFDFVTPFGVRWFVVFGAFLFYLRMCLASLSRDNVQSSPTHHVSICCPPLTFTTSHIALMASNGVCCHRMGTLLCMRNLPSCHLGHALVTAGGRGCGGATGSEGHFDWNTSGQPSALDDVYGQSHRSRRRRGSTRRGDGWQCGWCRWCRWCGWVCLSCSGGKGGQIGAGGRQCRRCAGYYTGRRRQIGLWQEEREEGEEGEEDQMTGRRDR